MNAPVATHRRRRPSGEPPPLPRSLNRAAIVWLVEFVAFALLWTWIFLSDAPAIWITLRDLELMAPLEAIRVEWLDRVMIAINGVGTHVVVPVLGWVTLIAALAARRVRHALILMVSLTLTAALTAVVAERIRRPRPLGTTILGDWEGFAQPSRPVALLAAVLVGAGLSLIPQAHRRVWFVAAGCVLGLFGLAQVYTAVDHPSDVFAGQTVGIAITMFLFRMLAPEAAFPIRYDTGKTAHLDVGGPRGVAIRTALRDQLNIDADSVTPVHLESSAGSTPLRIEDRAGNTYFGKLYASSHLRSDRSYKLGRTLLYGQLEDEARYQSVRRLVQHEDYMLHVMQRVGVRCPEPLGVVEITPEREYLLVTQFLAEAEEIGDAEVTEDVIHQALDAVSVLWKSGLAHRDIKPGNVMVQHGRVHLVDVGFAQIRPSPWRQAVDLANMMLVLALRTSPSMVFAHARDHFTDDEIAEAFAASRGVTLPSQLRRDIRSGGRELLAEFRELAPARRPVSIQRLTMRRVTLTAGWGVLALGLAVVIVSGLRNVGML